MKPIFDFIDRNRQGYIDRLLDYLRQPSISAHGIGMGEVAQYLVAWLDKLGLKAALMPTAGWPMVLGQRRDNPSAPTVLLYGHYDVQPPDPLELWISPPFEPTLRGENLYGRGASDMKGQVVAAFKALEAIIKNGRLPVNVKWLLEGEEEIGYAWIPPAPAWGPGGAAAPARGTEAAAGIALGPEPELTVRRRGEARARVVRGLPIPITIGPEQLGLFNDARCLRSAIRQQQRDDDVGVGPYHSDWPPRSRLDRARIGSSARSSGS